LSGKDTASPIVSKKSQPVAAGLDANLRASLKKWQISAIPAIWHAPCNRSNIGGLAAGRVQSGEFEMLNVSHFMKHALAALAAVFITGTLMVHSLAQTPEQIHSVAGILA
jgi:hypothetical protein